MTRLPIGILLVSLTMLAPTAAQERNLEPEELVIRVKPAELTLAVGASAQLEAEVVDIGGRPVKETVFFFSRARRSLSVDRSGKVTARRPGVFQVVARVARRGRRGRRGPSATVKVTVPHPEPEKIQFTGASHRVHTGTTVRIVAAVIDTAGLTRDDLDVTVTSDAPATASVDPFGFVTGVAPGKCSLVAESQGMRETYEIEVVANPVASLELDASARKVRTGDVIRLKTMARDAQGNGVLDVPVHLSFHATQDDDLGPGASGQIEQDGRFVAETPGLYTIVATCGTATARTSVRAKPRNVDKRCQLIGRGRVHDVHTSDLWVWEGVDGRDYCVTGTWGANGEAIFWDVTNPRKIERIATIKVDARTVNDVKVSPDGKLCVLSREGASNRKNGIVVVNVENPREPRILSKFTEKLTGGVHNVFLENKRVFALSAGRRYDIIDLEDPEVPRTVGSYQIFKPGASIHDVWITDGIAYSSNWRYGVHLVDVGNGIAGGSSEKPVLIGEYAYPSGWNHAAFPFKSPQTGKFYVVAGDEAFPFGLNVTGKPTYARGYFHFIDFTDMKNPKEVARYEVPEAGTHNLWIEGDVMYGAYYNGGLRVVDVSGELMGDLYRQGREIAFYLPSDPRGKVANAPFVWGPQPHKGYIYFSDWNTGLWCVKLAEKRRRRR